MRGKVFGAFDAAVTAKGGSLQSADGFTVHAQMSQNFLSDLTSRAAGVLQQAAAQASAQIASAQRDVTNAQADVEPAEHAGRRRRGRTWPTSRPTRSGRSANAQAQVTAAQNSLSAIDAQIASTRAGIQAERDAAAKKIQDAQAQVNAAQGPVNDLNSQISSLQGQINQLNSDITWWNNWYNNSSKIQKAFRWAQLAAEVGWRGTKVAALTTGDGHPAGLGRHRQRGAAGRGADPARRAGRGGDLPDRPGPADRGVAGQPRRSGSRPAGGAGRAVRDAAGDRGRRSPRPGRP